MSRWISIKAALPDDLVNVDVWAEPNTGREKGRRFADVCRSQGYWIRNSEQVDRGVAIMGWTITHWMKVPGRPRS